MSDTEKDPVDEQAPTDTEKTGPKVTEAGGPKEYGGRKDGTDPTRYGDWEKNGRCVDF